MTKDTDVMWAEFYAGLTWQPIAEYDLSAGRVALLRAGNEEAIGYWKSDAWWHAQESLDDQQLSFEPTGFAEVDDEWRIHLMAD